MRLSKLTYVLFTCTGMAWLVECELKDSRAYCLGAAVHHEFSFNLKPFCGWRFRPLLQNSILLTSSLQAWALNTFTDLHWAAVDLSWWNPGIMSLNIH